MFKSFLNNVIHFDFKNRKKQEPPEQPFEERVRSWVDFAKECNKGEPKTFLLVAIGDNHDQLIINHKFQSATQMLGTIELLKHQLAKIGM